MSSKLLSWLLGTASKNSARVRPSLEALEDRLAPSPTIRPAGALPPLVSALPLFQEAHPVTADDATGQHGRPPVHNKGITFGGTIGSGGQTSPSNPTAPVNVVAGQVFTLTLTAYDDKGHRVPSYRGTVHFSASRPMALPSDYTFTAADAGQHTFALVAPKMFGPISITVTDTTTHAAQTFTINVVPH